MAVGTQSVHQREWHCQTRSTTTTTAPPDLTQSFLLWRLWPRLAASVGSLWPSKRKKRVLPWCDKQWDSIGLQRHCLSWAGLRKQTSTSRCGPLFGLHNSGYQLWAQASSKAHHIRHSPQPLLSFWMRRKRCSPLTEPITDNSLLSYDGFTALAASRQTPCMD